MSRPKRPRQDVQAFAPCLLCGQAVLSGQTSGGRTVHLDPQPQTYVVLWKNDAASPTLTLSRAYVVHTCPRQNSDDKENVTHG